MKKEIDVSNHGLTVNGEAVKSIELSRDYLLTEKNGIVPNNNEKEFLVTYNLADGSKWVYASNIILELKTLK